MNKYDFIRELNAHLKGKVTDRELSDTIAYYEDYIDTQIRKGSSEEEVIAQLGSPRLLAKTIVTAHGVNGADSYTYDGGESRYENEGAGASSMNDKVYVNGKGVPAWLVLLIIMLVLILVIVLVFKALIFLAPVLLVGAAAIIIYKFLTGKL